MRNRFGATQCLVGAALFNGMLLSGTHAQPAETSKVLITQGVLDSWRIFHGNELAHNGPTENEIRAIGIQQFLSEKAIALDLDTEIDTRVALWWQEVSLLERELRRHWATTLAVPQAEIDNAASSLERTLPKRVRLRTMLVAIHSEAQEHVAEKRALAESYRDLVLKGEDFRELARNHSDSQSRWSDGLIGWIKPGRLAPRLEKVAMAMEPGEVSPVVSIPEGFILMYCTDVKPEETVTAAQARSKAEKSLRRKRLLETQSEMRARIVDQSKTNSEAEALLTGTSTDPGTPILTSGSLSLNVLEVRALMRRMGGTTNLSKLLEEAAYRAGAAAEARRLKLSHREEVAARLTWTRTSTLAAQALRVEVMQRFVEPVATEIATRYAANHASYMHPETYLVHAIAQYAEPSTIKEKFSAMTELEKALGQGEIDFPTAAGRFSELPSAKNGGNLGWMSRNQLASLGPIVNKAFRGLRNEEVSALVQQPEGIRGNSSLWIIRRTQTRPPSPMTLKEAYEHVKSELAKEQIEGLQAEIHQDILQKLDIQTTIHGQNGITQARS